VAKRLGMDVVSLDLEPIYTPDIETDILDWDYKKYAKENNFKPDFIWASPPCNTYSPLAYPLKERDTQTAEPKSERAKLGTKILYKTLEIIDYFKSINPNLLFVIENPRGMMRKDKKMKKLYKETTLYCLYGDFKRKATDFWTNAIPLNLKQGTQCKGKVIGVADLKTIEERYSIPSKLVKHLLTRMLEEYKK
jgi:site-specific DNA-cytosine methylase